MEGLHPAVNVGGPEITVIRIPAASVGCCQTLVFKPKQAATWARELAASATGAFKWIIDLESGGYGQRAAQPGS